MFVKSEFIVSVILKIISKEISSTVPQSLFMGSSVKIFQVIFVWNGGHDVIIKILLHLQRWG